MQPSQSSPNPHFDPGMAQMVELSNRLQQQLRAPEPKQLHAAFRAFFNAAADKSLGVEDVQAGHALRTFQTLMETTPPEKKRWFENKDVVSVLQVLERKPTGKTEFHRELAKGLFAVYEKKGSGDLGEISRTTTGSLSDAEKHDLPENIMYDEVKRWYTHILCFSGFAGEAHELLKGLEMVGEKVPDSTWLLVFEGYAAEGREDELHKLLEELGDRSAELGDDVREVMVKFYAARGRYVKRWHKGKVFGSSEPDDRALNAVVKYCLQHRDMKLGQEVVKEALDGAPSKSAWDSALLWAAGTGKSIDGIEQMINVMASRARGKDKHDLPDIQSINKLIEYALSKNDAYAAERYRNLGKKLDFKADGQAYLLAMRIPLIANDLLEAMKTYQELKSTHIEFEENDDVPVINRLLTALCSSENQDYDTIMSVVDDLTERGAKFLPETVSALSLLHLERDEIQDLIQLLKSHAARFSSSQRAALLSTFVTYCLDPERPTDRAWDVSTIVHDVFDEVDRPTRTQLMEDFFRRGRADKACIIFNHMRDSLVDEVRATAETYVVAFVGIAMCTDTESLRNVHNQLKVDITVNPDTKMYNALILAYTSCGSAGKAIQLWDSIYHSSEGPSFNSFNIMFWTCENLLGGAEMATPIWETLNALPTVEIPKDVFIAYLGALAGSSELKEATRLVETELGYPPDATMLGTIFNALPEIHRQSEMEAWAREKYPEIWTELEQLGRKRTARGTRRFQIDRTLEP